MDLPIAFVDKMKDLLGSEAESFFASLESPSRKAITVNFSRIDRETFEKSADFDIKPIEGVTNGYYTENLKVGSHIFNHLGLIYSQEPSAMIPVEMLDIEKGDFVLDISAAPGGKSIQILEKLDNTGILVSNEIVYNRAKILYENLSRMGFKNFAITNNSPADFENTNLKFDKILVDAPCGGEGMIRKNNFDMEAFKWSNIETNAKRQLSILESVKGLLKDGGRLVYSTCTYDIRENEGVIAEFLKLNPNFKIIAPDARFDRVTVEGVKLEGFDTHFAKRRYPHKHSGEGQFMAILIKDGKEEIELDEFNAYNISPVYRKDMHDIEREIKSVVDLKGLNLLKRNETIFVCPDLLMDFGKLNLVSIGTVFGNLSKSNFKINHNFYHTYADRFTNTIKLDDVQVNRYLHGEEIDIDEKISGIVSITHKGIPLGGGKAVNGRLKNYYPKDLRI